MNNQALVRSLGWRETSALVVGTVIGTGVFLKAATMSQTLGSATWVLAAWAAAGLLSYAGALCYAELGSRYPQAGGEYVYLREGYGDLPAFLYGWMRFWIGSPGSIAAYAVGAATFLGSTVPIGASFGRSACALFFVFLFSAINCFSVRFGGGVQVLLTSLKLALLLGLSVAIFCSVPSGEILASTTSATWSQFPGWSAFGTAMIAALWAFDGWNNMPMAAGEVRDPARNIPIALGLGMAAVLALYLAVNTAYFLALPISDIVRSFSPLYPEAESVAARAAATVLGSSAAALLSIGFVVSALGAMNGSVLTGARIPFAMARDGLFFSLLGRLHPQHHTPVHAVITQGVVAACLALTGTFDQLTDYVVFTAWIFYALATASLFIHRWREAKAKAMSAGFRVPFFPWFPLVFLLCALLLLGNTIIASPRASLIGLFFIASGIPVFYFFRRRREVS